MPLPIFSIVLLAVAHVSTPAAQASDTESSWVVKTGGGVVYHMHERNSDEQQVLLEPEFNRPLGRHWEYVLQAHLSRFTSPPGYFAGLLPLGVRYLPWRTVAQPFVALDLGFGWTDLTDIPEISRRFNFILGGDLGVRWNTSGGEDWQVSGRLQHISNAGTATPNLGLNMLMLVVGRRFP